MKFRQVHLDFHTSEKIPDIGKEFSKENFQSALKAGNVDSITLFSKCHHGWAYHPTKANIMHPNLDFDLLKAQIDAAHEIGVKTPVYLSVGYDEKYATEYPEHIEKNRDGGHKPFHQAVYHRICLNTPYLDVILSQIEEVVTNYDADGIFLDIVGVYPCYCKYCRDAIKARGKDPFCEEDMWDEAEIIYANYTKRVRETIDKIKPGLPVFHNCGHIRHGRRDLANMNTHLELESLPTGGWGYDHFPQSAKYAESIGMEYLGMTGKFHGTWGEFGGIKHSNALIYETSLSVSNGAKISVGDQLHPSGKMDMATYQTIGKAFEKIQQKEPWLDNVKSVAQIAFLSPEAVANANKDKKFPRLNDITDGAARILIEGKYLFDIIDLQSDLDKYDVVIITGEMNLPSEYSYKIREYVKNGGKILSMGTILTDDGKFILDLGAEYIDKWELNPTYIKADFPMKSLFDSSYVIYAPAHKIKCTGEEWCRLDDLYFNRTHEHFCSHQHAPNTFTYPSSGITEGKDGVYIAWNLFEEYAKVGSLIAKETIIYVLDRMLGDKKIFSSNLPSGAKVTLMHQESENRYINHLLYASPVKRGNGVEVIEDIIPIYDTEVNLRINERVKNVYLAPEMTRLDYSQNDNLISYKVPKIDCHQMVIIDY